jgi:tetratricopeptide (TPR) repeat protein
LRSRLWAAHTDDATLLANLSGARMELASAYTAAGQSSDARREYREVLLTSEKLSALDPENSQWRSGVAVSWQAIAEQEIQDRNGRAALAALLTATRIIDELLAKEPTNRDWITTRGEFMKDTAEAKVLIGDDQGALVAFGEAIAAIRAIEGRPGGNGHVAAIDLRIGDVERRRRHAQEAVKAYAEAIAELVEALKVDPKNDDHQGLLAGAYDHEGDLRTEAHDRPGAEASYRSELATLEPLADLADRPEHRAAYAATCQKLAAIVAPGAPGEARALAEKGLAVARALKNEGKLGPKDAAVLAALEATLAKLAP